ncbi:mercury(II) reductase [Caballeronia arationis]|jgi:pyruvate/2-oxoglutarate dehydrogenase complex dihydrolipoamide dehydrogenase (E3) component|uniref:Pyruvate/2-oxoglutarate dehydrogenase complex, dihydrolipoamide dehydrogenase (E3) component n=1 Tax=Caballeronia arationis TaxID=1777142 RepID=A0A7Z7I947_9BURK|nr:FAD-containing oxidoreductase [Caballeronia arationis]SAK76309.1 mercury(II) reductase [Caballeronia arationis]SOE81602.1 Pyruvate/2-oxoglutarate dehydrogenase complex, dihydrolipoamide dehydrogenase (E3) component [Caballeronia arationis]
MSHHFDAVVIGTGQGGGPLAVRLAESGRKTAVIERHLFGGTCVNVGCTPTKTYVASARAAHVARHAAEYGVLIAGDVQIDMARVKARKDEVIGASRDGVEKWLRGTQNLTVFTGHGRFTGPHSIRVDAHDGQQHELESDATFINTGTRPTIPPIDGIDRIPYLTNSTLLELTEVPAHLVIVGASYIALEFAQMFRRFGSRVTVLVRGKRVLTREDADFAESIQKVLAKEGVEFRFGGEPTRVEPLGDGVRIGLNEDTIDASHLLFATGRQPNTDDLGLDAAGVAVNAHGLIDVDGELRTQVEGIWAIGDVNGRGAFTHTSYNDFEIVAAHLIDNEPRSVDTRIMTYAVFVDPPYARVGMSESEVRKDGREALIATMPMSRVGRARERGETDGFMKALVDAKTKQILGAAIHGIEGDEAIHTFVDIMNAGAPYTTLKNAMHIHPTVSELIPTLLGMLKPLK